MQILRLVGALASLTSISLAAAGKGMATFIFVDWAVAVVKSVEGPKVVDKGVNDDLKRACPLSSLTSTALRSPGIHYPSLSSSANSSSHSLPLKLHSIIFNTCRF